MQSAKPSLGRFKVIIFALAIFLFALALVLGSYLWYQQGLADRYSDTDFGIRTGLFRLEQIGDRELMVLSGTIVTVGPEMTNNSSFPIQHMFTLQSASVENVYFQISMGNEQRAVQINYPNRASQPGQLVTETIQAGQSSEYITPGTYAEVFLGFPADQPQIREDFVRDIQGFADDVIKKGAEDTFPIHFFRFHNIHLYE